MPLATRLIVGLGLLFTLVAAWVIWFERWKARNGIVRQSGGNDGGADGSGWFSGDGGGGHCGSDGGGGGDGGGGCD